MKWLLYVSLIADVGFVPASGFALSPGSATGIAAGPVADSAAESAAPEVLNFQQALTRALVQSPDYQILKLKADSAELETKNAWAVLFPTADLKATHSYSQQNSSAYFNSVYQHYPWSTQAGLSITENLYDNGLSYRRARTAELNESLQKLALESGRSQRLITVAKAYYDYSLAVEQLELQKQQLQALKTQFRAIEGRYQQGLSSNRDYLRIKAQGQSTEIGLLSQEIQLNQTKQTLRVAIGDSDSTEFLPLRTAKEFDFQTPGAVDPQSSFEFRTADLQEKISQLTLESASRLEWPRVSVQGNYNYTVPQYLGENIPGVDAPYWNLQLLLVLEYRLWDWGATQRSVKIAENQRRSDGYVRTSDRTRVVQEIRELESRLKLLKQSFDVSRQILRANQEAFDSLNRGYRDGKISYLELITALNAVYSSRSQDLSLRFNILKSRLDWAYYQGNVDEALKNQ